MVFQEIEAVQLDVACLNYEYQGIESANLFSEVIYVKDEIKSLDIMLGNIEYLEGVRTITIEETQKEPDNATFIPEKTQRKPDNYRNLSLFYTNDFDIRKKSRKKHYISHSYKYLS